MKKPMANNPKTSSRFNTAHGVLKMASNVQDAETTETPEHKGIPLDKNVKVPKYMTALLTASSDEAAINAIIARNPKE
jgi:hypothetical protein